VRSTRAEPVDAVLLATEVLKPATVQYVADLWDVQTRPHYGDPKTDRLLTYATDSTKGEELWGEHDKHLHTL